MREPKLSVSLEGEWELVRDLRLQQYLPSEIKDGRTLVSVPLETEPCTLLALIPKPKLTFEDYKSPAKLTAYTGSGDILIEEFATTNDRLALDADKVVIQELLTGHAKEYQTKPSNSKGTIILRNSRWCPYSSGTSLSTPQTCPSRGRQR